MQFKKVIQTEIQTAIQPQASDFESKIHVFKTVFNIAQKHSRTINGASLTAIRSMESIFNIKATDDIKLMKEISNMIYKAESRTQKET